MALWRIANLPISFPNIAPVDLDYLFDPSTPVGRPPLPPSQFAHLQAAWASTADAVVTTRFCTSSNLLDSITRCWSQIEAAFEFARAEHVLSDPRVAFVAPSAFFLQMLFLEELALRSLSTCHHLLIRSVTGSRPAEAMLGVSHAKLEAGVGVVAERAQLLLVSSSQRVREVLSIYCTVNRAGGRGPVSNVLEHG